jgi:hypothetical protein
VDELQDGLDKPSRAQGRYGDQGGLGVGGCRLDGQGDEAGGLLLVTQRR